MSLYDDWKTTEPVDDDYIPCADCHRPASESCHLCDAFLCRRCEDGQHVCEAKVETVVRRCTWVLSTGRCTAPATNGDVCCPCEDARDKRRD